MRGPSLLDGTSKKFQDTKESVLSFDDTPALKATIATRKTEFDDLVIEMKKMFDLYVVSSLPWFLLRYFLTACLLP